MATTSLWHIEGRLKDLIAYVENPEKNGSKQSEFATAMGGYVLCPAPRSYRARRICFRYQLSQRDCIAADDTDQKAVWKR